MSSEKDEPAAQDDPPEEPAPASPAEGESEPAASEGEAAQSGDAKPEEPKDSEDAESEPTQDTQPPPGLVGVETLAPPGDETSRPSAALGSAAAAREAVGVTEEPELEPDDDTRSIRSGPGTPPPRTPFTATAGGPRTGFRRPGTPFGPGTGKILREGLNEVLRAPFLRSILRVPLKKVAIWVFLFGAIYFLRDFFGLIFMTFVLSYITSTVVNKLEPFFSNRKVPVLLIYLSIVGVIIGTGAVVIPRAFGEGRNQLDKLGRVEDPKLYLGAALKEFFKVKLTEGDEVVLKQARGEELTEDEQAILAGVKAKKAKEDARERKAEGVEEPLKTEAKTEAKTVAKTEAKTVAKTEDKTAAKTEDKTAAKTVAKTEDKTAAKTEDKTKTALGTAKTEAAKTEATKTEAAKEDEGEDDEDGGILANPAVQKFLAANLADAWEKYLIPGLKKFVTALWLGCVYVVLALVFSFMIVWDAPKLAKGIGTLENSRLGEVWHQVAPSIATFFRLLGRAFEAQTMIALMNTFLTFLGMWALGIPGKGFLSVIVFLCSFIPIVGMWISTAPICVMAVQATGDDGLVGIEGGPTLILLVVGMVVIVHIVEGYVLNPRIYGFHMKMHPLAVLIVLYLAQHLFGLWGLIVAVPVATYIWRHVVMGQEEHIYQSEDDLEPHPPPDPPPEPAPPEPAPA